MSRGRCSASEASLMSSVAISDMPAGFCWFRKQAMVCVTFSSYVLI